ncbi:MAG: type II toxin-antitoxin system RelE/ParE family toxin [Betaproteobacteria bacterium]|nr:type II toxin-antitoxin system RelE/ParE family toxin [Betaproteobacteria bacterium]
MLAKLSYSGQALADPERLADFLIEAAPSAAAETVGLIEEAVALLIRHPLIGRPVEHGLRELVISRGRTGYIALYSFEDEQDAVLILAIRHQREAGYWTQGED